MFKRENKEKTRPEYDFHNHLTQLSPYTDLSMTVATVQGYTDRESREASFDNVCCMLVMNKVIKNSVFSSLPEEVVQFDLEKESAHMNSLMKGVHKKIKASVKKDPIFALKTRHRIEAALRKEIVCRAIIEAEGMSVSEEEYQEYIEAVYKSKTSQTDVYLETQRRQSYLERKIREVLLNKNVFTEKRSTKEALLGAMKKGLPIPTYLEKYLVVTGDENTEFEVTGKMRCDQCQSEEFAILEGADYNLVWGFCAKCDENILLYNQYECGWNGVICHSEEDAERKTDYEGWLCGACDSKHFNVTIQLNSQGKESFIENCLIDDYEEEYKPDDWVDAFDSITIALKCAKCGAEFDELCYEAS